MYKDVIRTILKLPIYVASLISRLVKFNLFFDGNKNRSNSTFQIQEKTCPETDPKNSSEIRSFLAIYDPKVSVEQFHRDFQHIYKNEVSVVTSCDEPK